MSMKSHIVDIPVFHLAPKVKIPKFQWETNLTKHLNNNITIYISNDIGIPSFPKTKQT